MKIFKNFCAAFVKAHRLFTAPLFVSLGVRCRFSPSCSEYALQALEIHGAAKGSALTFFRLARCHPFCEAGYDPVPLKASLEIGNG